MQHPFQCITAIGPENDRDYLIAACGPKLISLNFTSGEIVSEWTAESTLPAESNHKSEDVTPQPLEPPAKRQKTEDNLDSNHQQKKPKQQKQKKNSSPPKSTTIILLAVCPDQRHLVAVTDDKSIIVLAIHPTLHELGTRREMPKRPCAIQIPPSNDSIHIADKHGDVYSLPLFPSSEPTPKAEAKEERTFKPSATNLTVHSKRNLSALSAQQAQKNFTPRKDTLAAFENTLLLGHVSMLTDMKFLTSSSPTDKRAWIATCDRDEHIRISRAPPQAHVIEGFCLGHTGFVSRICQVGPSWLVSGGGDEWLGVWDFLSMKLVSKVDLLSMVSPDDKEAKIAVSGIWSVGEQAVVVTCERVKALFVVKVDGTVEENKAIPLEGFPLDVEHLGGDLVIISMDRREGGTQRIQVLDLKNKGEGSTTSRLAALNGFSGQDVGNEKALDDLLYNVANLRKRGAMEDDEAAEGAGDTIPAEED